MGQSYCLVQLFPDVTQQNSHEMVPTNAVVVVVEGTPENPKIDEFQNRDGDAMLH